MDSEKNGMELEGLVIASSLPGAHRVSHARPAFHRRVGSTLFRLGVHLIHITSTVLGDDIVGRTVRTNLLRLAGASIGSEAFVHGGTYISKPSNLTLGFHALINRNCYLDLEAPIVFGDYCGVGHGATFVTTVHDIVPGMNLGVGSAARAITVGDRAWIGANVTVLPGVTIGSDAIVAACTLVTRDVAPNTLVAGVPARLVRKEARHWLHDFMNKYGSDGTEDRDSEELN